MSPPQTSLENLTKAIAEWERNLSAYTANSDNTGLDEKTKLLCL